MVITAASQEDLTFQRHASGAGFVGHSELLSAKASVCVVAPLSLFVRPEMNW